MVLDEFVLRNQAIRPDSSKTSRKERERDVSSGPNSEIVFLLDPLLMVGSASCTVRMVYTDSLRSMGAQADHNCWLSSLTHHRELVKNSASNSF